jgi:phenylacetate-CoA ligase
MTHLEVEGHLTPYLGIEPARMEEWQLEQLRELVERASTVPFYARRFRQAGVDASTLRSMSHLRAFPPTYKEDFVRDNLDRPPYGTRISVPQSEIAHVTETSGTTGTGREIHPLSRGDEEAITAAEAEGFSIAGIRPGDRVMNTIPVGLSSAGIWYYLGLRRVRANVFSLGPLSGKDKLDRIVLYGCDWLIGTPSYLKRLETLTRTSGVDPRDLGVRNMLVAGEPYPVAWAQELERAFGARLFEQYGCTQRVTAWSCERGAITDGEHGVLHQLPHRAVYEVVDPETWEPVAPGEVGQLVVTPLFGEASAIIRFVTRDRVRLLPEGSCKCGRSFPGFEAGTISRYDNMLKVRGVNFWPDAVDAAVLAHPAVGEYTGVVRIDKGSGQEVLEVSLEPREGMQLGDDVVREISTRIQSVIGLSPTVRVHTGAPLLDSLPEGFVKRNRWQDLRPTHLGEPA